MAGCLNTPMRMSIASARAVPGTGCVVCCRPPCFRTVLIFPVRIPVLQSSLIQLPLLRLRYSFASSALKASAFLSVIPEGELCFPPPCLYTNPVATPGCTTASHITMNRQRSPPGPSPAWPPKPSPPPLLTRTRAHSLAVAPVVMMSSTNNTSLPRTASASTTRNAPRKFFRR